MSTQESVDAAPWIVSIKFTPGMEDAADNLAGEVVYQSWQRGPGHYEYSYPRLEIAERARDRLASIGEATLYDRRNQ